MNKIICTCPLPTPMGETEIKSRIESALELAGGNDYLLSEVSQQKFLNCVDKERIKSERISFSPAKVIEELNGLDTEFQFGVDRTRSESTEDQLAGSAEGSNAIVTVSGSVSGSVQNKSSSKSVTHSASIPPNSVLCHEKGFTTFACTFKVSLKNDCTVTFKKSGCLSWFYCWLWGSSLNISNDPANSKDATMSIAPANSKDATMSIDPANSKDATMSIDPANSEDATMSIDPANSKDATMSNDADVSAKLNNSVKENGYLKTVTARYVLGHLPEWVESDGFATIEFQCEVETERLGIYKLGQFVCRKCE